jgi:hypothetical protein
MSSLMMPISEMSKSELIYVLNDIRRILGDDDDTTYVKSEKKEDTAKIVTRTLKVRTLSLVKTTT